MTLHRHISSAGATLPCLLGKGIILSMMFCAGAILYGQSIDTIKPGLIDGRYQISVVQQTNETVLIQSSKDGKKWTTLHTIPPPKIESGQAFWITITNYSPKLIYRKQVKQ